MIVIIKHIDFKKIFNFYKRNEFMKYPTAILAILLALVGCNVNTTTSGSSSVASTSATSSTSASPSAVSTVSTVATPTLSSLLTESNILGNYLGGPSNNFLGGLTIGNTGIVNDPSNRCNSYVSGSNPQVMYCTEVVTAMTVVDSADVNYFSGTITIDYEVPGMASGSTAYITQLPTGSVTGSNTYNYTYDASIVSQGGAHGQLQLTKSGVTTTNYYGNIH